MPADRSRSQRQTAPARRKRTGGSIGPLFFIMAAIVAAVVITAVLVGSNTKKQTDPVDNQPKIQYKTIEVKPYWETHPAPEPWHGLEVGASRAQVLKMFGKPNKEVSTPRGYDRLEFYDDPSRAGVFGNTGGSMLTVFVDKQTNKVLYFIAPDAVIRSDQ